MSYETLDVRFQDSICFVRINRPEADNTINGQLVADCNAVLAECEESATVVVLSGSPEVFCMGADFRALAGASQAASGHEGPGPLYDLWLKLATGPCVTVAHVRGKANAGGNPLPGFEGCPADIDIRTGAEQDHDGDDGDKHRAPAEWRGEAPKSGRPPHLRGCAVHAPTAWRKCDESVWPL